MFQVLEQERETEREMTLLIDHQTVYVYIIPLVEMTCGRILYFVVYHLPETWGYDPWWNLRNRKDSCLKTWWGRNVGEEQ
jgi:hypothetical protein